MRQRREEAIPAAAPTHLAVTRRQFVVRRSALSAPEYELLSAIAFGETVGAAIERVANRPDIEWESLESDLHGWFRRWAADAYFLAVVPLE